MKFEIITVGMIEENCVIAYCDKHSSAIIIDPGDSAKRIISFIEDNSLIPKLIINTHCHADHTGAIATITKHYNIPFFCHEDDIWMLTSDEQRAMADYYGIKYPPMNDGVVKDGEKVDLCEDLSLQVIHTPGHTPGGICLLGDGKLISGDTLFQNSIGRTDLTGGDSDALLSSLKNRILTLSDETVVYPGHGETTTIALEKSNNPFLRQMEGYV